MADLIQARATVNLRKLPAGKVALVDPASPYIAMCLKRGLLVRVGGDPPPAVPPPAELPPPGGETSTGITLTRGAADEVAW